MSMKNLSLLSSPPNEGTGSSIPFHSGPISTETGINFGPVVIIAGVCLYMHFAPNYVIVAMNLFLFCFSKNASE